MTAIWNASAVTPLATDRIPVDVSSSGAPSRWTGQNIADIDTIIGGTVTALGSINTNTALNLALGGYFSATITGNLTFSITNVPASAGVTFVLALTNGGAFTVTLPGSVTIIGGSPVLSATGTDWLVFRTLDGGTAWTLEVVGNPRDADLATWATITPGTGVGTALAANVGSAGAVVTNGGALGTPSSGTLTNATGLPPAGITQSGATSNQVLAWNGSAWAPATPSAGSGDVVGPASATDNAIARFDTTTGKLLQNTSNVTIADTGALSITPDANAKAITVASHTHTTSNPAIDIAQTFNAAGVAFTGVKLNFTQTAKATGTRLFDVQSSGTSAFRVESDGNVVIDQQHGAFATQALAVRLNGVSKFTVSASAGDVAAGSYGTTALTGSFGYGGGTTFYGLAASAGAFLRYGTTAQRLDIAGTYTDASNYVLARLAATSTSVTLSAQTAGTGADDVPVVISPAGVSQVEVGNGVQFTEMTAPSAPASNKVILYAQDNGAGKTQLMALFASGASQQVAIEP